MSQSSDIDPRRGFPSASAMHRLANCPGSLTLVNVLRTQGKLFESRDAARTSGIKIHQWLAADRLIGQSEDSLLSQDELHLARECQQLADELIDSFDPDDLLEVWVERRLWYRNGLWAIFSGQPDYAGIDHKAKRALLLNFKTGRLEAEEAADNLQLRAEVVLLKHAIPELENIRAAIVEPWVSWETTIVEYNGGALAQAEAEILGIANQAYWQKDTRIAGPWCRYCPARIHCPEAIKYVESLGNFTVLPIELPRGEHGVSFWQRLKVAKKLIEDWEAAYTKILEAEPDALPGYILPERGRPRRYVPFPRKFKDALADYLSDDEIDGCADYHLTRIEELIGIKHKIADKELGKFFEKLTKGIVAVRHDAPFIRPLTKRERETTRQNN